MSRIDLTHQLAESSGQRVIKIIEVADGWPSMIEVQGVNGQILVALHISRIGSHARAPYEKRFQNPANRKPVQSPNRAIPILVGVMEGDGRAPIIAVDGRSRVGRNARFSILFHDRILVEADTAGWATYVSGTGEKILALRPKLFPIAVSSFSEGVSIPRNEVVHATRAAGLLDDDSEDSAERVRRSAQVLVRDQRFGGAVVDAYDGVCAMCGMDFGLVQGAHIYPASAPNSPDQVWNGLALCPNHHLAFDQHKIWIEPGGERRIHLHESIHHNAQSSVAAKAFVDTTQDRLSQPNSPALVPREEMFERRYSYFHEEYKWK